MTKLRATDNDICNSMHSSEDVDPFEGLDLKDICVTPDQLDASNSPTDNDQTGKKLFDLNPLDNIDFEEISITPGMVGASLEEDSSHTQLHYQHPAESEKTSIRTTQEKPTAQAGTKTEQKDPPARPAPALAKGTARTLSKVPRNPVHPLIEKAYHYAELTQIRQKIFASLDVKNGKTLLIASPLDNTGSSLLAAALAYNTACSCQQEVLLVDCNMRRAGLHDFFFVPQSYGFTDLIQNNLPWQAVVKQTSIEGLSIITAGDPIDDFADYLRYSHIPNLVEDIRNEYDLIIFDTSPILKPNRNNVNIVSLTTVTDYFLLVTKQDGTTKDMLKETKDIVEAGNGKIDGIVINEHSPSSKPAPYKK